MNFNILLRPDGSKVTKEVWRYNDKVIATNGFAMIALDVNSTLFFNLSEFSPLPDPYREQISDILTYHYDSIQSLYMPINLQDFKDFIGEPEYPKECDCRTKYIKCDYCNGKGTVKCNLGEEHDCEECAGSGGYYCDKCVDCWIKPKKRYISVLDVVVNGNILSQYLAEIPVDHDDVSISVSGDKPMKISGKCWDIYIMPVRDAKEVISYDEVLKIGKGEK